MQSASNRGILNGCLQMLYVYVFLISPLGASHMAQPGTNQHEGRVAVREAAYHTGAAANLPVQLFNDIVGTNTGPVLAGEITVSQRFSMPSATFLAASFSFMERSSSTTALAFSRAAFLLFWAWIALRILATSFTLERGVTENTLR